jgi:hypothetical protein
MSDAPEFDFVAREDALAFVGQILDEMRTQFGIDDEEALGRINRQWKGMSFESQADVDTLTHERAADWARIIYYGPSARWWDESARPTPVAFP